MVLAWKNLQEVFLMLVVVVVLPHWRFLRFRATFPCHRHSTLASQAPEGLHQLWALPWLLSVTLLLPGFFVTFVRQRYRFEWAFFTHTGVFFTLPSFPTSWYVFMTQMRAGKPHPGSSSVHALTELSLRLTHGLEILILQIQDHWFINCASEPRNVESKHYLICFNQTMLT